MKNMIGMIFAFGSIVVYWVAFFKTQSWFGLDYNPLAQSSGLDSLGELLHFFTFVFVVLLGFWGLGELLKKLGILK